MKKEKTNKYLGKIVAGVLSVMLLVGVSFVPVHAKANVFDDIQAKISQISQELAKLRFSFWGQGNVNIDDQNNGNKGDDNKDQKIGNNSSGDNFCHVFTSTLTLGSQGSEVVALNRALALQGFGDANVNSAGSLGNFTETTASEVVGFQEKYRSDILTPAGLQFGTGIVGPNTRAKLNTLYPCNVVTQSGSPVIDKLEAPTVLGVNETGTWKVTAHDPENGSLKYAVVWGDETQVKEMTTNSAGNAPTAFSQDTTFSHAYASAGTYNPTFTVIDDQGLQAKTSATVRVGSVTVNNLTYSVSTDKSVYNQDENIVMTITAKNNTANSQTLNFSTTCQTNYSIGNFNSVGECNSYVINGVSMGGSVVIPAYSSHSWTMTNTPGIHRLDPGTYTVTERVIGYGEGSTQITVNGNVSSARVDVTSPANGESWRVGSVQTIKWQVFGAPATDGRSIANKGVDIILVPYYPPCTGYVCPMSASYPYQAPYTIAKNVFGTSFDWNVGAVLESNSRTLLAGSYRIEVCTSESRICGWSNGTFTVYNLQ